MNAKPDATPEVPQPETDTELLLALLEDALDGAEFDALMARLRTEAPLRRRLLALAGDEETLREWSATAALSDLRCEMKDELLTAAMGARRRPSVLRWMVATMTVAVAGLLALTLLWPVEESGEIATITRTVNARWAASMPDPPTSQARPRLVRGQRIELASGQVEIMFNTGVRVWLQGPAYARLTSVRSIEISRGRLAVDVGGVETDGADVAFGPGGEKFAVITPGARVVDHGTRFVMDVADDGEIGLVVYEGLVQTHSRAEKQHKPIDCWAGVALRIDCNANTSTPSPELTAEFAALGDRLYDCAVAAKADHYVCGGIHRTEVDGSGGGPRGDSLLIKRHMSLNTCRKAWIRFDLSKIDYDATEPATFVFRHNEPAGDHDFRGTVVLYALAPGFQPVPQEQGIGWLQDQLTWDNAPGNDRNSQDVKPEQCIEIGQVDVDTLSPSESARIAYHIPIDAIGDVLQDDGSATFILCVRRQSGPSPNLSIAARDNQKIAGPELIVPLVKP